MITTDTEENSGICRELCKYCSKFDVTQKRCQVLFSFQNLWYDRIKRCTRLLKFHHLKRLDMRFFSMFHLIYYFTSQVVSKVFVLFQLCFRSLFQKYILVSHWNYPILFLKMMEQSAKRLTTWCNAAIDAQCVKLLPCSAFDFQDLQYWCDVPDMIKCDVGELASPLSGDTDTKAGCQDFVQKTLPALEAFVWELPYTVNTVCAIGFCDHIKEGGRLDVIIDVVGITVV